MIMDLRVLQYPSGTKVLQFRTGERVLPTTSFSAAVDGKVEKSGEWRDVPIVMMKEPVSNI